MSYLVLARKYRPQSFAEVIGQEHVTRTLQNALALGRVHHAYLFTGSRGVGKTTVARLLAKAMNCAGEGAEPCGECPSCVGITNGSAVDVFEIDGASNTGVNDVRELRENIKYLPAESSYKIFIVDEVHMLSTAAFNGLLKILEEPPRHVRFIFATTEPHKILPTILSRCQRFDFRRLTLSALTSHLRTICDKEEVRITGEALQSVALASEGSVRDSLSILDQVLSARGSEDEIGAEAVGEVLGIVDRKTVLEALRAATGGDAAACLRIVDGLYEFGHDIRRFCHETLAALRNALVLKVVENPAGLVDLPEFEIAELGKIFAEVEPERIDRLFTLLAHGEGEIMRSAHPRMMLELIMVKMALQRPVLPVEDLLARIEAARRSLPQTLAPGAGPSPPPVASSAPRKGRTHAEPPAPAPSAGPSAGSSGEKAAAGPRPDDPHGPLWWEIVEKVRPDNAALASLLEDGRIAAWDGREMTVEFPGNTLGAMKKDDASFTGELARPVARHLQKDVAVKVSAAVADTAGAARPPLVKSASDDGPRRINEEAMDNPVIREAQRIMEATVSSIRPIKGKSS